MSMTPLGSNPLEPQGPDNKRLLITVALCTALWLVFNQVFMEPPAPATVPAPTAAATAPIAPSPAAPAAPIEALPGQTSDALPEQKLTFLADIAKGGDQVAVKGGYRAEVSTHGAVLTSFQLTGYDDNSRRDEKTGKAPVVDLADAVVGTPQGPARTTALSSRGGDVALAPNATYELVEQTDRSVTLTRLTASGVRVTKSFKFDPSRFAFVEEVVLKNESAQQKTALLDLLLVGKEHAGATEGRSALMGGTPDKLSGVCSTAGEREHFNADALEEATTHAGSVGYAGIDKHFFLAAIVPTQTLTEGCRAVPTKEGDGETALHSVVVAMQNAPVTLAPGEVKTLQFEAYFGPKQVGLLDQFGHGLSDNIDFGIFGVISKPMLWLMVKFHEYVGNFGLAIILLTFVIKLLTFPLTQKSYRSMAEMKKLAPEIKELQKKYGNDRATLGQKQMALYQEKGVNPMAGCFPVLVQLPVWFALYRTLASAVELYQQPAWGWITDLTQPDASPLWGFPILPIIVGILMLGQTAMQPPPEDQPQMKYVMWGMPVMFTFFMLGMASGLSIYMITNSLLTMAQQYYIKRKYS